MLFERKRLVFWETWGRTVGQNLRSLAPVRTLTWCTYIERTGAEKRRERQRRERPTRANAHPRASRHSCETQERVGRSVRVMSPAAPIRVTRHRRGQLKAAHSNARAPAGWPRVAAVGACGAPVRGGRELLIPRSADHAGLGWGGRAAHIRAAACPPKQVGAPALHRVAVLVTVASPQPQMGGASPRGRSHRRRRQSRAPPDSSAHHLPPRASEAVWHEEVPGRGGHRVLRWTQEGPRAGRTIGGHGRGHGRRAGAAQQR